ncbi:Hypothetical predicted protein [Mytilus galloprovincialis]|uniref:Uncharacterized protein n=1 Tax=Mytilus galloprovincialis TaxID=29158 RepID=A0A8B6BQI0_MYTGA|nr:Hypothetical predicted protein [Mytilus galloprovincialis]
MTQLIHQPSILAAGTQQQQPDLASCTEDIHQNIRKKEDNIKLQLSKAKHLKTKLKSVREEDREKKTSSVNMEKETKKLWNLKKALNDEGSKGQKITLEVEKKTTTGKPTSKLYVKKK